MGKLLVFPGVVLNPPSRNELVDEASEMILKEVLAVFVEQRVEPGCIAAWHREIREFFWRQEIKLVERDFRQDDVRRWKLYWRDQAFRFIDSRRIR